MIVCYIILLIRSIWLTAGLSYMFMYMYIVHVVFLYEAHAHPHLDIMHSCGN